MLYKKKYIYIEPKVLKPTELRLNMENWHDCHATKAETVWK